MIDDSTLAPSDSAESSPSPNRLVLLTNPAMRARRRPVAIALYWAFEALVALVLSWPFSSFAESAYGGHPQGDAPLWAEGGLALADLVARSPHVGAALGAHAAFALGIGTLVGLVPLGALLVTIAHTTPNRGAPPNRRVLERAIGAFAPFLTLLLVAGLVQIVVGAVGLGGAWAIARASAQQLGEARAQQLGAVFALLFGLLWLFVGVAHDLARAAVVRFDVGAARALRIAFSTLSYAKLRPAFSWGWRAAVAWAPVAIGAVLAHRIGARAGFALLALTAIHQLVALARVALRASWLAKALRLVDDAHRVLRRRPR